MGKEFYEKIRKLCKERGIALVQIQRDLGIHISTIKGWEKGQTPAADRVLMLANYFNVSTDFILGVTDVPTPIQEVINDPDILSLQKARTQMSQRDRDRMMQLLRIGFDYAFQDADTLDSN